MGRIYDLAAYREQKNPLNTIIDEVWKLGRDSTLSLELGVRVVSEMVREVYGVDQAIHFRTREFYPTPISDLDV